MCQNIGPNFLCPYLALILWHYILTVLDIIDGLGPFNGEFRSLSQEDFVHPIADIKETIAELR